VHEPRTDEERQAVASTCAVNLRLQMPAVVDGIDNAVASAYGGWPDRLYLIGRDGRIAFQGGEGPFGFKPDELERAIELELALV
jgi:Iodothyronine deiodinase